MRTCPVCEHSQPTGDECEVCGHREAGPLGTAEASGIPPLPGLEPTQYEAAAPAAAEASAITALPGLEPTRYEDGLHEDGAPAPSEASSGAAVPGLEPSRADPVGAVAVDPVPDIERHLAEPLPEDLDLPRGGPTVCRYCRTPAGANDKFCGRCGMRLSRFEPARVAAEERGELVCPDCGAMGQGPRCRRCGARMASPG